MTIYAWLKIILSILGVLALISSIVFVILGAVKKSKKLTIAAVLLFILFPVSMAAQFMVSVKQYYGLKFEDVSKFEVTSEDLHDGVWDVRISHDKGEDLSPQLSWDEVPGAAGYAVYMLDPDATCWVHMKTITTSCTLDTGAVGRDGYIGPYPPAGSSHSYVIYVFALKELKSGGGTLDFPSNGVDEILSIINTFSNSDVGNVISCGVLQGEYPG